LAPAARVEFLGKAPSSSVHKAQFITNNINTGPDGDCDPTRAIANIVLSWPNHDADGTEPPPSPLAPPHPLPHPTPTPPSPPSLPRSHSAKFSPRISSARRSAPASSPRRLKTTIRPRSLPRRDPSRTGLSST